MNRNKVHFWRWARSGWTFLFMVSILLGLSLRAEAAGPQIKLRQQRGRGPAVVVDAYVVSRDPLGAYTLEVSFDPSVLELTSIGGGAGEFAAAPFANPRDFASGRVRFSAFQPAQMQEPRGACHVARLTFRSRVPRAHSPVRLSAITVADTLGSKAWPRPRRLSVWVRP